MTPARTRIAPSPTGEYHIGHLRTCLYDYALARQTGGQFVLRIEDTDQKRFVPGSLERIMEVIKDYGISWDEGPDIGGPYAPYVQTQRLETYQKYARQLIDQGNAYYCFCSEERLAEMRTLQKASGQLPKYDRHCLSLSKEEIASRLKEGQKPVIRLLIPKNETLVFNDIIRGTVKFNSNDVDDQVIVKSNGIPTYHLAVVVDDHLMNITHVFRGEEWITSTPKQILLNRYLGWTMPQYAHLTVLMDPAGRGKMSKRHGSVSARSFLDDGYLPQAVLNFLMLLGWNPGDNREVFTLKDFVEAFSLDHLHKKSPAFDRKKLDYFNGLYIRQSSEAELFPHFKKFLPFATDDQVRGLIPILKDRISKFSDLTIQLAFLFEDADYEPSLLLQRGANPTLVSQILTEIKATLSNIDNWQYEPIQSALTTLIAQQGWNVGQFFMVFRVAICGVTQTPPLVETLPFLGKDKTLSKIELALNQLSKLVD
ncbi:MAG: glutamate--tRNA ligase [Candidatus Shapirobacteria bacterium]|jgi:glutamyl-tRNA synthetase